MDRTQSFLTAVSAASDILTTGPRKRTTSKSHQSTRNELEHVLRLAFDIRKSLKDCAKRISDLEVNPNAYGGFQNPENTINDPFRAIQAELQNITIKTTNLNQIPCQYRENRIFKACFLAYSFCLIIPD